MKCLLLLILISSCSYCPYTVQKTERYEQGYKIMIYSKCDLTPTYFYSLQNYSIGDTLK
jgi:hypothetical protein